MSLCQKANTYDGSFNKINIQHKTTQNLLYYYVHYPNLQYLQYVSYYQTMCSHLNSFCTFFICSIFHLYLFFLCTLEAVSVKRISFTINKFDKVSSYLILSLQSEKCSILAIQSLPSSSPSASFSPSILPYSPGQVQGGPLHSEEQQDIVPQAD